MSILTILTSTVFESIEEIRFLDIKLIEFEDFTALLIRLLLNLAVVFVIVRFMYYRHSKNHDFLFSYFAISVTVFLLCFLLENVKLELGFALGLFAIFGIIRYRTDAIPIKEMTYLFTIIGVSVINALSNKKVSHAELLLTNLIIVLVIGYLEKTTLLNQLKKKRIVYEKIENITPQNHQILKQDLEQRLGMKITRIEIGNIDYLKDSTEIFVYYSPRENQWLDSTTK